MFSPFVGALIVVGALGMTGLGLGLVVYGRMKGVSRWVRAGVGLTLATVAGYGLVWVIGLVGTPRRALPLGEEVAFCGLDCHLHVSVVRIERAGDLGVVVRFRSNARAADEFPGLLRLEVVDASGRRYQPSAGMIAEPLSAGEAIEREFRFSVPAEAQAPTLVVRSGGWLDYLVPGRGNPLAQERTRLALDRA